MNQPSTQHSPRTNNFLQRGNKQHRLFRQHAEDLHHTIK